MVYTPPAVGGPLARPPYSGAFHAIVVMGPSGCGKSTLASALAQALGWNFIEGDDHHPPENIARMQSGQPLTERDRLPFLASVGRELAQVLPAVASCSALRRAHRDILRGFVKNIFFVLPNTNKEELARRIEGRESHFMPSSLLQNQISSMERPTADESFMTCEGSSSIAEQIQAVIHHLSELNA